ncbi:MAG TPA: SMP-30/gluconolactonase/LRE family protein [Ideonella sp.]|uniref:SMP-30/gluconolactonase/LRE family protein n=1 Tax=Ideonella sp. TaxID=1929293 RepID=UPI002BA2849B|nr:SMP-30/gluconolactonase/LRE family protein [Ideonella sp.]HSI47368.1 SMP-30/gluconolactonase/LRE family protein [Ideonella sp.]
MSTTEAPRLLSEPRCAWAAGATLGEGTCWSPSEQALYWVDILGQQLHRWVPATDAKQSWDFDDTISAVAERATQPGLAITLRRGLALFNPKDRALQVLDAPEPELPGNRFNDGKCDAQGRFWGGTMDFACEAPTGSLYRFDAAGQATLALQANFPVTNGPTWSRDQRTMFFNDTVHRKVMAYAFDPVTGEVGAGRVWLKFSESDGHPDGMTSDAAGRLWICHWGAACVTCHDPVTAAELLRVPLPTDHITNVAFGGPDLTTLHITSARFGLSEAQLAAQPLAGALFTVETNVTGLQPNRFAG